MQVDFYKLNSIDRDTVDKITGLTPAATIQDALGVNKTTYGGFTPLAPQFVTDTLVSVNYMTYTYNGLNYRAYVQNIDTGADGLYIYRGEIDPLGTAWANGCFTGTGAQIAYSDLGSNDTVIDDRISFDQTITETSNTASSGDSPRSYIAVNIIHGYLESVPTGSANSSTIDTYIMTEDQFYKFLYDLAVNTANDADRIAAYNMIVSVFPIHYIPQSGYNQLTTAYQVRIWSPETYSGSPPTAGHLWHSTSSALENSVKIISYFDKKRTLITRYYVTGYAAHSMWERDTSISISVPYLGVLSYKLSAITSSAISTSDRIGVRINCDPSSGTYMMCPYLRIDGTDQYYTDMKATATVTEAAPIPTDLGVEHWSLFNANSALTLTSSILSSVNPIMQGMPSPSAAMGALLGSLRADLQFKLMRAQYHDAEITSTGFIGGGQGGSVDLTSGDGIKIYIRRRSPISIALQNHFGKPDGHYRSNLSSLSGYVQTVNVHLPLKGLPESIIRQAEVMCDSGVFF